MGQLEGAAVNSDNNKRSPMENAPVHGKKNGRVEAERVGRGLVNAWGGKAGERVDVEYYKGTENVIVTVTGRLSFVYHKNSSVRTPEHAFGIKVGDQLIKFRNLKKITNMKVVTKFEVVIKKSRRRP
jgi:hypothetical protein